MARIDDLIQWVSLRVDEYLEDATDAASSEIPFGDISFELDQAAKYLLRTVRRDLSFFATKAADAPTVSVDKDTDRITIELPADYLRFTSLKVAGWKRAVNSYQRDDTEAYHQQQFRHLRGTAQRPKVFLVPKITAGDNSNYALEAYPAGEGTVDKLLYVPVMPAASLPDDFDDALVWKATSNVLQIMRHQGLAKDALGQMEIALRKLKTGLAGEELADG